MGKNHRGPDEEKNQINNVFDFTSYKLCRMVDDHAKNNQFEYAEILLNALELYSGGKVDIVWIEGEPHLASTRHKNPINTNNGKEK